MSTDLVKYNAARQALQEAHSIDEVKDILNKSDKMRAYAKQAKDKDLEMWAAEIKLRAERRAGEMLQDMDMAKGGRPELTGHSEVPVNLENNTPTLSEMEISKNESSQWQQTARIPKEDFEEHIETEKAKGKTPTSTGLRRNIQREERINNIAEISKEFALCRFLKLPQPTPFYTYGQQAQS